MDPEEQDAPEVLETPAEDVSTPEEETVESLKEKNAKLYTRAKQAEGFVLEEGQWVKKPKIAPEVKPAPTDSNLSPKDIYALMKAEVPEEDIDEVQRAAKVLGVTVAEAIKDPVTKAVLERRATLRKTAEATNTITARPAAKQVTDDEILKKAAAGDIPDKGSEDAERLFWARHGGKR